jgi:hypothetical protein
MAMSYNHHTRKTCGYLGFQSGLGVGAVRPGKASPGDRLMALLELAKDKACEPMLLPASRRWAVDRVSTQ